MSFAEKMRNAGSLIPSGDKSHRYDRLLQDNSSSESNQDTMPHIAPRPWPRRLLIYNIILFGCSIICLLAALTISVRSRSLSGRDLLRETSFYSIAIDELTPEWGLDKYVTHPLESEQSVFRQQPSDEVDAAWGRIADLGVLVLKDSDVERLGKNTSTVVQAPASWGLGSDAYLGQFDGIHLLHCLDSMRKSLYHNYEHYFPNGHKPAYFTHLGHCQEALTKYLMCQPSLELITFNWVEHHIEPFPDFDITRKCWKFDRLMEWQDKHRVQSINTAVWHALKKPDDVVPMRSPILNNEANNISAEEAHRDP